jgi:hypothetical protein
MSGITGIFFGEYKSWSFMKFIYSDEVFAGYWTRTSATESMFTMMKNDNSFAGRLILALQELLRLKSSSSGKIRD